MRRRGSAAHAPCPRRPLPQEGIFDACETDADDCAQQPCLYGGTCHDRVANYFCECPPGRTGLLCHLEDACASNPCNAGAECKTDVVSGKYNCSCPKGFVGPECNVDINECDEGKEEQQ